MTSPEDQVIHDYSSASTRVRVHGVPQPSIEWKKDGKIVDYSALDEKTNASLYKVEFNAVSDDQITSEFEIVQFKQSDVGLVSNTYERKLQAIP